MWQLQKHLFTQLPESGHHVHKCGNALIVRLRQVSFEMVAQCEQVVSQVHAVVVLDGSQVRELEQVLSGWSSRGRETTTNTCRECVGQFCCVSWNSLTCGMLVQRHRTVGRCSSQWRRVVMNLKKKKTRGRLFHFRVDDGVLTSSAETHYVKPNRIHWRKFLLRI